MGNFLQIYHENRKLLKFNALRDNPKISLLAEVLEKINLRPQITVILAIYAIFSLFLKKALDKQKRHHYNTIGSLAYFSQLDNPAYRLAFSASLFPGYPLSPDFGFWVSRHIECRSAFSITVFPVLPSLIARRPEMKKLLLCVALAISLCALSQTARADLTGSWTYNVDAKITGYTLENGKEYGGDAATRWQDSSRYSKLSHPGNGSLLEWGRNTGQYAGASSLSVTGSSGEYIADGTKVQAAKLEHNNQTIDGSVSTPTVIDLLLDFTFTNVEDDLSFKHTVDLFMGFTETTNNNNGNPATDSDVFYFLNPFTEISGISILDANKKDSGYLLSLFNELSVLDFESELFYYDIAYNALRDGGYLSEDFEYGHDIYGWVTDEKTVSGKSNEFSITFEFKDDPDNPPRDPGDIDPTPTPEPATMLIFGLGIAGGLPLALRRRRNRN